MLLRLHYNLVPRVYSAFKMATERRPWHTPLWYPRWLVRRYGHSYISRDWPKLSSLQNDGLVRLYLLLGTFRSDYDYEYEYDFWAREAWVLAVVDTVVAVVSSQQKYFSNFCEYEVITFCQSRECLVDKQHKMPQSRQNIARQVARNISQCIRAFKD